MFAAAPYYFAAELVAIGTQAEPSINRLAISCPKPLWRVACGGPNHLESTLLWSPVQNIQQLRKAAQIQEQQKALEQERLKAVEDFEAALAKADVNMDEADPKTTDPMAVVDAAKASFAKSMSVMCAPWQVNTRSLITELMAEIQDIMNKASYKVLGRSVATSFAPSAATSELPKWGAAVARTAGRSSHNSLAKNRRRDRKLRSKARHHIWIAKVKRFALPRKCALRYRALLSKHHSKDPSVIAWLSHRIALDSATMAKQNKPPPWKCRPCKRVVSGNDEACPLCWTHWTLCADANFVAPRRPSQSQKPVWNWSQWDNKATPQPKDRPKTPRRREGKEKREVKQPVQPAPPPPAPFPMPFDFANVMPAAGPSTAYSGAHAASVPWSAPYQEPKEQKESDQELLSILRKAFPDQGVLPEELREAMNRSSTSVSKRITADMHRATNSLGKARKALQQAQESQRLHRQQWLKHLEESTAAWNAQLKAYQVQQAQYEAMTQQARADFAAARESIKKLNEEAAEMSIVKAEIADEPAPGPEEKLDAQEQAMRARLQDTLQQCAQAVPPQPDIPCVDLEEEDDEEMEERRKRARSEARKSSSPSFCVADACSVDEQPSAACYQYDLAGKNRPWPLHEDWNAACEFNEFQAVANAQSLRWSVLCDMFENGLNELSTYGNFCGDGAPQGECSVSSSDPQILPMQCPFHNDQSVTNGPRASSASGVSASRKVIDLHMEPIWIQDLVHYRKQLSADATVMQTDSFHVRTWFVANTHRSKSRIPRIVQLTDDITEWYDAITHAWLLEIDFSHLTTITVVHPLAPHTTQESPMIDIIISQGIRRHEAPILAVTCSIGVLELEFQRVAAIAPNPPSKQQIEAILDVEMDCGFALCTCAHNGRNIEAVLHPNIVLTDGAMILCSIHPVSTLADASSFMQHTMIVKATRPKWRLHFPPTKPIATVAQANDPTDVVVLMQRGANARSRSPRASPDDDPIQDVTPEEAPAGNAFGITTEDIFALHPVPYMLASAEEHVILIERTQDREDDDNRALVMIDILCHHQQEDGEAPRFPNQYTIIFLMPPHATFGDVINVLALTAIVQHFPHDLAIENNGFPWYSDDETQVMFGHGDHILLNFGPYISAEHQMLLRQWLQHMNLEVWNSPDWIDPPETSASTAAAPSSSSMCPAQSSSGFFRFPESSFVSWFISHTRFPRCEESRIATLGPDFAQWKPKLQRLWSDRLDDTAHMQITLVFPRPTAVGVLPDDRLPHMIIEQHPLHRQVAAVFTLSRLEFDHVSLHQYATSLPELSSPATIRSVAEITDECVAMYQCQIQFDGQILPEGHPSRRPTGMSISILMTQVMQHSDLHSMLQVMVTQAKRPLQSKPAVINGETSHTVCTHTPDGGTGSTENTIELETDGTNRISARQRAFTRNLHTFQDSLSQVWERLAAVEAIEEGPVLYLQTYYVSPVRQPVCPDGRPTRITGGIDTWLEQMQTTWADTIDRSTWVEFFIVVPQPIQTIATEGTSAHVLLVQHTLEPHRAILITTCTMHAITHRAAITFPAVTRHDIIRLADQLPACIHAQPPDVCDVTYRWQVVTDTMPFPVDSGFGIQLTIAPAPAVVTASVEPNPSTIAIPTGSLSHDNTHQTTESRAPVTIVLDEAIPRDGPSASGSSQLDDHSHLVLNAIGLTNLASKLACHNFPLHYAPACPTATPNAVELYTDGSYLYNAALGDAVASWAFVVVHRNPQGQAVAVGYACGKVASIDHEHALDGIHPTYGHRQPDSCSGEIEAILRALQWMFQSGDFQIGVDHEIVSDALTIINSAAAACQFLARPIVSEVVRPLYEAAVQMGQCKSKQLMQHFNAVHHCKLWTMPVDQQAALFHQWFSERLPVLFPLSKRTKRASQLSASTWELLQMSRRARRQLRNIQRHMDVAHMRAAFQKIRCHAANVQIPPPPDPSQRWHASCIAAMLRETLRLLSVRSPLEHALKSDAAWHVEQHANRIQDTLSAAQGDKLWLKLRPYLPHQRQKRTDAQAKMCVPVKPDAAHACSECDRAFETAKALAVHRLVAHGRNSNVRCWMYSTTQCLSCLKVFNTTQKLRQHLQHPTNPCLVHLQEVLPPLSESAIQAQETVTMKSQRAQYREPAKQAFGPMLPPKDVWMRAVPHHAFPVAVESPAPVVHTTAEQLIDWFLNTLPCLKGPIKVIPGLTGLASDILLSELEQLVDFIAAGEWDHCPPERVQEVLQWCLSVMAKHQPTAESQHCTHLPHTSLPKHLPSDVGKFYVIYLYSGSRRYGDVHSWAAHFSERYNCEIEIVAVDIVFDSKLCNLMNKDSRNFWLQLLRDHLSIVLRASLPPVQSGEVPFEALLKVMPGLRDAVRTTGWSMGPDYVPQPA
eukprot:Skav231948  [mRNA]  locus=scaffold459:136146:152710:- [translate_table: standard]